MPNRTSDFQALMQARAASTALDPAMGY
jgi:hypothetical protein